MLVSRERDREFSGVRKMLPAPPRPVDYNYVINFYILLFTGKVKGTHDSTDVFLVPFDHMLLVIGSYSLGGCERKGSQQGSFGVIRV